MVIDSAREATTALLDLHFLKRSGKADLARVELEEEPLGAVPLDELREGADGLEDVARKVVVVDLEPKPLFE